MRKKIVIGQVKARSISVGNLLKIKKNLSEKPENFNAHFGDVLKLIYDRKERKITLGTNELLEHGDRYVVLTPWQAVIVNAVKKATARFTKNATVADLLLQENIKMCSQAIIRNILKSLDRKRIMEREEITIRDQTIDVFKLKIGGKKMIKDYEEEEEKEDEETKESEEEEETKEEDEEEK